MPRVASRQSANPFVAGVVLTSCAVVHSLSDVGTENACTPARLEALFTSSQSSPFVPSRIRSSRFRRIVNFDGGAVVQHTRESFSHTMSAFCPAVLTQTNNVAIVRDTLQVVEFLTSANKQDAPGKSPIWYTWKSETLENSGIYVAGDVARSARHRPRVAVQSPIATRRD